MGDVPFPGAVDGVSWNRVNYEVFRTAFVKHKHLVDNRFYAQKLPENSLKAKEEKLDRKLLKAMKAEAVTPSDVSLVRSEWVNRERMAAQNPPVVFGVPLVSSSRNKTRDEKYEESGFKGTGWMPPSDGTSWQ